MMHLLYFLEASHTAHLEIMVKKENGLTSNLRERSIVTWNAVSVLFEDIYVCIYIYIYIYTHIGWYKTNIFKLLIVSYFHIHQSYTITLTRSTHIITTKFKLLSYFLTPMSIVLINIAVNMMPL